MCVEFRGRQAPQAVESAQKIPGRAVALARVAFDTAGNQVAVGIPCESLATALLPQALFAVAADFSTRHRHLHVEVARNLLFQLLV